MTGRHEDVERIIQDFLDRRARGEAPQKEEVLQRHAELRADLTQSFETIEALDRLVSGKGAAPPRQATIGDFRILREIGRGGMGVVFLAEQTSLHRPVALKVMGQPLGQSHHTLERFRREAEIAARLHHPNLVAVYSVGETQGYPYFAMEYVRGVTLGQVLAQLRELAKTQRLAEIDIRALVRELVPADIDDEDWSRETPHPARPSGYFAVIAGLVADLADGLDYAHGRGVIHRDVKPQNILLDRGLTPQLADFGLAKDVSHERLSITGDLLGTPYYMSPEIAMAGRIKVDHRTDIYSLGVTLYELLTLRVPFSGSSSNEVLRKIVLEPVTFPRRLNPSVPKDLQVIALKAMEKDPDQRYASAAELAEDLRRFLRFDPITARPPGPMRIAARMLVRHRVAAGFAAVALLAGLGMAGTGMLAARNATIGEKLARATRLENDESADGSLLEARDEFARILKEHPDMADVKSRVDALNARLAKEIARVSAENDEHVRLANAGFRSNVRPAERTARILERLGAKSFARLSAMSAIESVPITSVPTNASVTAFPLSEWTGAAGAPIELARTNVTAQLEVGTYRVVVDGGDAGFGEYFLRVDPNQNPKSILHATLRPTSSVIENMVRIPGGRYTIGRDRSDIPERIDSDLNARVVELPAFYIDRNEVTNAKYAEFCLATRRATPSLWKNGMFNAAERNDPVRGVTWIDAVRFAEWAGKRLPTEIEWEAACRGPNGDLYSWGKDWADNRATLAAPLPTTGLKIGAVVRAGVGALTPADAPTEDRTPTGLLHMIGNVREWTMDPWIPRTGAPNRVWWSASQTARAVRGASFFTPADEEWCTATRRADVDESANYPDIGFRCAKSVRK